MKSLAKLMMIIVGLAASSDVSATETLPQRIVAAGGDMTEIVYALGAGDRLIGVDSTSRFPVEAQKKEQIGYVRRISAEGILSLNPDLVLGASDMGPPAALEQVRATGVKVAVAPEGDSPEGIVTKILFVGEHLGLNEEAQQLAENVQSGLEQSIQKATKSSHGKRVIFVLSIGDSGVLVGGEGTAAAEIIELSGGVNAAQGFSGYKPMSREAIVQAQPEVVLMMNRRGTGHERTAEILQRPEFKMTPAAKTNDLISMDGLLLLGFGPRTPKAIAELSAAINR